MPRTRWSASAATQSTPRGAGAGSAQPVLRHALLNGVNTLYGSPEPLVTVPGATAYGVPVATPSTESGSASTTARSRARP